MDRVTYYQEFVKQALCAIVAEIPQDENVRTEVILDDEHGHYELMEVGWEGPHRIHGCLVHCDIVKSKIYVEHDGTDFGVADFLLAKGVPHEDIVLGFHPPQFRKLTPFAVA